MHNLQRYLIKIISLSGKVLMKERTPPVPYKSVITRSNALVKALDPDEYPKVKVWIKGLKTENVVYNENIKQSTYQA